MAGREGQDGEQNDHEEEVRQNNYLKTVTGRKKYGRGRGGGKEEVKTQGIAQPEGKQEVPPAGQGAEGRPNDGGCAGR